MRWTAPTTGIVMCQIPVAATELRESAYGYEWLFGPCRRDDRFAPGSRPSSDRVRFATDFVGVTPGSGPAKQCR